MLPILNLHHAKKKNLVQTACDDVAGFSTLYHRLEQQISLTGRSNSTLVNYGRHLAKAAIHFNVLPTEVDSDKISEYLYHLQQQYRSASDSYFKFTVFGLRFAYRMEGLKEKYIALPSIKKEKRLPVILSRAEVRRLIAQPKLLKHKVLLGLLYGCGLRCFEARNIQLPDIDFDRRMLHVRQGKNRKDRYVPLSSMLVGWLQEYIAAEKPTMWLFNGRPNGRTGGDFDNRYSNKGVQFAVKSAALQANIIKKVTVHTLRHTFATHLLEDGLDVVSVKDLLGHSRVDATMVYLHVAQFDRIRAFSPLDTLYGVKGLGNVEAGSCALLEHIRQCKVCNGRLGNVLADR